MGCKKEVSADGRTRLFGSRTSVDEVLKDRNLEEKTFLITGTTSGIGVETARALAHHGAHVVMANRNQQAAERIRDQIYSETNYRNIDLITLDLLSLQSVKAAAEEFLSHDWPLHGLILNAGVVSPPVKASKDGYNATWATNHLAHFYFALLLKDRVIKSKPSRIVILASDLHRFTSINAKDSLEKKIEQLVPTADSKDFEMMLYNRSKLCNVLFAFKLHREINHLGVNVIAAHPGSMIDTGLQRGGGMFLTAVKKLITNRFTKTVKQGAACSVFCATHPDLENVSGRYFESCWDDESYLAGDLANDIQLQNALWDKSIDMIKKAGLPV
ncbi:unnamed protein product [Bursaphelenchus okinawaensis]|uniref:Uncharacterized protein n=1 Tax=Bursaphelenchus okinawaensis TaxID=465554 RepID=A0A811KFX0_9BILA|nr:unnamed protein product [Bursaphelenchus okinawaensis]CAG9102490.1 unnamed protein product [Bursaphelenchus okinawaensis]